MRRNGDGLDFVEDRARAADVLLERGEDGRRAAENFYPLRGADCKQRWHRRGEDEGGAVNALQERVGVRVSITVRLDVTWWSTTVREPAQKPPDEQREFAMEPTRRSTFSAYPQRT